MMEDIYSVKICIVGPSKSGKSSISSYVADTIESVSKEYRETKGVRILELESGDFNISNTPNKIIELWDCSGSKRYQECWPAMRDGAHATVIVADPDKAQPGDLLEWYNEFVVKTGLSNERVIILLHRIGEQTNDSSIADFRLPPEMSGITITPSNIDREGDILKNDFNKFLVQVFNEVDI